MNFQPVLDSFGKILSDIADFIPRLVNGLIILVVGYLICLLVRAIVRWVVRRSGMEEVVERVGINRVTKRLRVTTPLSKIIASLVFYFLFLSFATEAVRLMGLATIAELLSNILRFIPRAIAAGVVIVFGLLLANFVGESVTTIADNVNISYSRALGRVTEFAIIVFVVVVAVSTLGVDTTILTTSFVIVVACAGLAVTLSFGLGARETALNIIAGYSVQQKFQIGQSITLNELAGTVQTVSGAYTTLELSGEGTTPGESVVVPNALLLRSAIRVQSGRASQANNTPGNNPPNPVG